MLPSYRLRSMSLFFVKGEEYEVGNEVVTRLEKKTGGHKLKIKQDRNNFRHFLVDDANIC